MATARAVPNGLLRNALVCILPAVLVSGAAAQFSIRMLGFDTGYFVQSLTLLIAGAILVLVGLPRHHPHELFGPANQVTVVRGALVALLAGFIGQRTDTGSPALATVIATLVAILDGADGWLARRSGMTSAFGARFDMETDAALILVLSLLAWQFGKAGVWVLASGLLRYLFVLAGTAWPVLRRPLPVSRRRKAIAVLQMVVLIVAVAPVIPASAAAFIAAVGLGALLLSFLVDVIWLLR
jgi:phosphatidylglycerophosphate synthase